MPYLRPSIHSVSACEPRPSAASAAALYPRRAWSLDMIPARSARKPATAAAKPPMATRTSARCFAQVSCSSRLFTSLSGGWRPPPGSNDGDWSGIEVAGGSKLIGRTGRRGGSSVVTFVGSLQPFGSLGATISSEAHFVRAARPSSLSARPRRGPPPSFARGGPQAPGAPPLRSAACACRASGFGRGRRANGAELLMAGPQDCDSLVDPVEDQVDG